MGKTEQKKARKRFLFDEYERNLQAVKQHRRVIIEPDLNEGFMCPLCFAVCTRTVLDTLHHITLEHVPPESVGGIFENTTLTCPDCNNKSGHKLDHNLSRLLSINDVIANIPGATLDGYYYLRTPDNRSIQKLAGILRTERPGSMTLISDPRRSNPHELSRLNDFIHEDDLEIVFTCASDDPVTSSVALLRIAYLEAFRRFGYAFIASAGSQRVAQQIREPKQHIIPRTWVVNGNRFSDDAVGLYLVSEPVELRSLLVVFDLESHRKRKERYAVILPNPHDSEANIYNMRQMILECKKQVRVKTHQLPNEYFLETWPFLFLDMWGHTTPSHPLHI